MAAAPKTFKTSGVLTTFKKTIPAHRHFDKPLTMLVERWNNSIQHKANVITMVAMPNAAGDYILKYFENGDGKCDHDRFTSPQDEASDGCSVFGAGCHYHRLACDPSHEAKWIETFKVAGETHVRGYEGPFTNQGIQQYREVAGPHHPHFKTVESSGMTGEWTIRRSMLLKAIAEAEKSKKTLDEVILDHLTEIFGMKYEQSIIDKLTLRFQVGQYEIESKPDASFPSLETALQQSEGVYRFPNRRLTSADGKTVVEYTFYRAKKGVDTIDDYPHYGDRSESAGSAIIQVNPGFGFHTIEDMPIKTAVGGAGGGTAAALSGCTAFVKCYTTEKTPSGFPNMKRMFGSMAVKCQVDTDDELVKEFVFNPFRNPKFLPAGWKEAKNEKFESAPKYTAEESPVQASVALPPSPPPSPEHVPAPNEEIAHIVVDLPPRVVAEQTKLPAWMPEQLTMSIIGDTAAFTYTEKARIHDIDRDICECASAIAYIVATKSLGTRYTVSWNSSKREKAEQALARYATMFPVLRSVVFLTA